MVRESLTDDDREFFRSAPKKRLSKIARLFYAMLEGGTAESLNFHVAFAMNRIVLMPEKIINRWIVRPMKRLRDAA